MHGILDFLWKGHRKQTHWRWLYSPTCTLRTLVHAYHLEHTSQYCIHCIDCHASREICKFARGQLLAAQESFPCMRNLKAITIRLGIELFANVGHQCTTRIQGRHRSLWWNTVRMQCTHFWHAFYPEQTPFTWRTPPCSASYCKVSLVAPPRPNS